MASPWNDRKWTRLLSAVLLLAIVAYGGFLRYHDLGVSLYDDEINTRERAMQTVAHTLNTRSYPLYYLAAKATLQLGDTESALRLPSFIAGLLSILAIYGLVRQLHSRTAGLVAAALLAFSPFHITHSDFARYYALMMLFTILTVWMLYLVLERGRWHQWLAYTVSAFLALSAHICFAPALALLNIGAGLYILFQRDRGSLKRRVGAVILLACCTTLSAGFLIHKKLDPARFFTAATAASTTENAAPDKDEVPAKPWSGPSVIEAHQQHPGGSGAVFSNPDTGETRYLLTYYDCLEYLKRYFWSDTAWVWPLLIVVGIWGI
ncbi:MAG: glycosyltransferase family 39 protein, partial [Candidatus Hydrogenedentes bacterium]|nr:glycosyltransferase family 39 protein [Candidatus Hydrogenedentota bacterium]